MRKFFRRLGWGLLALVVLAAAAAFWKREELTRLMAVNSLFAEDRIVTNFSGMDQLFQTVGMVGGLAGDTASPLPDGPAAPMPDGFDAWAESRRVTATVVVHGGQVVHESYRLGTARDDLRISWSVSKSALSMLLGTLVADGTIPDINAPVTRYVPMLRGSAYDGASIRHVLNMASGIVFNEDYLDFWSDINRMGRVLAMGGSMDGLAAGQTGRRGAPGADWLYVSIDTHVIAMVIRGATGRSIADLMSERIFQPLGLERDPYYVTDGEGVEFVLGGLNMTTRDFARLGLLVEQDGVWQGRQIVPADWLAESTAPSAPGGEGYGYQWWIPPNAEAGEVYARGVYGQFVWIDRDRDVVISVNSADRQFRQPGVLDANIAMFRAIARSLSPAPTE